jgi:tRNA-2-methylthio-N6-dimethylallyladenosine synthase
VEVLVEGRKKGKWFGRTRSNKLVFFEDAGDWLGQLAIIRIEKTSPWSLRGEVRK